LISNSFKISSGPRASEALGFFLFTTLVSPETVREAVEEEEAIEEEEEEVRLVLPRRTTVGALVLFFFRSLATAR
jgi:hypothetical protein